MLQHQIQKSIIFFEVIVFIVNKGNMGFQAGDTKLEIFLLKNQHIEFLERKLLNFENWINGKVSKSAKI